MAGYWSHHPPRGFGLTNPGFRSIIDEISLSDPFAPVVCKHYDNWERHRPYGIDLFPGVYRQVRACVLFGLVGDAYIKRKLKNTRIRYSFFDVPQMICTYCNASHDWSRCVQSCASHYILNFTVFVYYLST